MPGPSPMTPIVTPNTPTRDMPDDVIDRFVKGWMLNGITAREELVNLLHPLLGRTRDQAEEVLRESWWRIMEKLYRALPKHVRDYKPKRER